VPLASLAGISQHYPPLTFTAACPCGRDATYTAFMAQDVAGRAWTPHTHIDCPTCGLCPCDWHEPIEGVAA
jgi:hypothetical protein